MAELKKYISFEALKLNKKPGSTNQAEHTNFLEFEAFLKQLQNEQSRKKKTPTENGKQLNR